jgi:hypothetical protein
LPNGPSLGRKRPRRARQTREARRCRNAQHNDAPHNSQLQILQRRWIKHACEAATKATGPLNARMAGRATGGDRRQRRSGSTNSAPAPDLALDSKEKRAVRNGPSLGRKRPSRARWCRKHHEQVLVTVRGCAQALRTVSRKSADYCDTRTTIRSLLEATVWRLFDQKVRTIDR